MRKLAIFAALILGLCIAMSVDMVAADELTDIDIYLDPDSYETMTFDVSEGVRFCGDAKRESRYDIVMMYIFDSEKSVWIGTSCSAVHRTSCRFAEFYFDICL